MHFKSLWDHSCVFVYDYVSYPSSAAEKSIAMVAAGLPNGQRLPYTRELRLSYMKLFSCMQSHIFYLDYTEKSIFVNLN